MQLMLAKYQAVAATSPSSPTSVAIAKSTRASMDLTMIPLRDHGLGATRVTFHTDPSAHNYARVFSYLISIQFFPQLPPSVHAFVDSTGYPLYNYIELHLVLTVFTIFIPNVAP